MAKIGRNTRCPCGSGRKFKHCCQKREDALPSAKAVAGRTRFDPGSYGDVGAFMPSLMSYRETGPDTWEPYYCLVKCDLSFTDEDSATALATEHLNAAFDAKNESGNSVDIAASLRKEGYKKLDDFRIVGEGGIATNA